MSDSMWERTWPDARWHLAVPEIEAEKARDIVTGDHEPWFCGRPDGISLTERFMEPVPWPDDGCGNCRRAFHRTRKA